MDRETASDRRGKTADIDTQTNEDKHQEEQTQNDRNMSRRETDPERWRYSISSKGFLPIVIDIMVI